MRILFITSNRVGDAVLSTGVLAHLIARYAQSRITVVCGPYARDVFARMPNRERTLVLNKRRWNLHWFPLWRWAASRRWDLVIDLRGSMLPYLVRAKQRTVLTSRAGDDTRPKIQQLARVLNLDPSPLPVAWTDEADDKLAQSLLSSTRPLIALAPTANWEPKIWPVERFVALFRRLERDVLPGAIPVIFAGPGETERRLAHGVTELLADSIDLAGRLTLPEVAACLRRCALFIGNDSGLMHLAAAAGTPTLGLFGPTPMEQYAPSGPNARGVRGGSTMHDLSVETVLVAATQLLAVHSAPERLPVP